METLELDHEISEICVVCGMCCDGTLFSKANIIDEVDRSLADSIGLSTIAKKGELSFLLPCHYFNHKCTIYDQGRPKICGCYFCKPIRELKKNRITLQEVRDLIFKAVRLKQQFKEHSTHFPELSNKSIRQIWVLLNIKSHSPNEQIDIRRRYWRLLLIGAKLFPLINQISNINKKSLGK